MWLSMFSAVTAVTRLPIGPIREDPDLLALCQAAALEGMAVAHAKGVSLPLAVLDELVPGLHSLPPGAKSSMLEDLERGRPLELRWLSGSDGADRRRAGRPDSRASLPDDGAGAACGRPADRVRQKPARALSGL